jgi:tRNA (cmo5U34)-methyltransferase
MGYQSTCGPRRRHKATSLALRGGSVSAVRQYHWDPDDYVELMRAEVPDYERLQDETAGASAVGAGRVLELGTGTGETARRVLAANATAVLVGIDASTEMLASARAVLPADRVQLLVGRLEHPLPTGPFDVVVSTLTVHHLDGRAKAQLFRRVRSVLSPGGRFVLGDVIVPEDPAEAVTPIDGDYDTPSSVAEQMQWLERAGLSSHVAWTHRDLAVLVGENRSITRSRRQSACTP